MSDDPSAKPSDQPRATPAGLFVHLCEHPGCQRWGSFGEPQGRETLWVCGEHRDQA